MFEEKDPTGSDPNRWQEGIDKWLETQSDSSYKYPREQSSSNQDNVVVNIRKPLDKQRIDNNSVEIEARASAVNNIEKMEIYIDGNLKETSGGSSINKTISLDNGVRLIKVKATASGGKSAEAEIIVGINTDPNFVSPTPVPPSATAVLPSPTSP